jgi:hypothetical protein
VKRLLVPLYVSFATIVFAMDSGETVAGNAAPTVGRGGVSVGAVSVSRDRVSNGGSGASVSASRDGGSQLSDGSAAVTASRDGTSAIHGGTNPRAATSAYGFGDSSRLVNARGDREYDDFSSWFEDLAHAWLGKEPENTAATTSHSSPVKQVSEASSTSTNGQSSSKVLNTHTTTQNN